jgi:hypothetical protein
MLDWRSEWFAEWLAEWLAGTETTLNLSASVYENFPPKLFFAFNFQLSFLSPCEKLAPFLRVRAYKTCQQYCDCLFSAC